MSKKKYLLILIILVIIYIILKFYYLNTLKVPETTLFNNVKLDKTYTVNHKSYEEDEYLTFGNMKILNKYQDFTKVEDNSKDNLAWYTKDSKTGIFLGTDVFTYVQILSTDESDITFFSNNTLVNSKVSLGNAKKFLKRNNINNDIDLLKYLEKNKTIKNKFYTPISTMKSNYNFYAMLNVIFPEIDSYSLITNDLTGYILNIGNTKEISILTKNKKYVISLTNNDYFTDDKVEELLNSIVIS